MELELIDSLDLIFICFSRYSSSSTPTVPYSTADILYGSEVNSRPPAEELRQNSLDLEKSKELSRLKAKDLEQHPNNRRPNSKSASRKSLSVEAGMASLIEPRYEISNNVVCATSKATDQPAHMRSLIRAIASRLNLVTFELLTELHLEFLI